MEINYQKEFGKRTVEVLEKGFEPLKKLGREVTFLMNCLLGTIVVISEKENKRNDLTRNSFLAGTIDETFFRTLGIPIKQEWIDKGKLELIKNIRHGIAHQRIEALDNGDTNESVWEGVIIKNDHQRRNFEITFTINELRNLAINLAKKYYEIEDQNHD
jgi:hypothetical protein